MQYIRQKPDGPDDGRNLFLELEVPIFKWSANNTLNKSWISSSTRSKACTSTLSINPNLLSISTMPSAFKPPTRCNNNCAAENRESGSIKRQEVGEKELKGSL